MKEANTIHFKIWYNNFNGFNNKIKNAKHQKKNRGRECTCFSIEKPHVSEMSRQNKKADGK